MIGLVLDQWKSGSNIANSFHKIHNIIPAVFQTLCNSVKVHSVEVGLLCTVTESSPVCTTLTIMRNSFNIICID